MGAAGSPAMFLRPFQQGAAYLPYARTAHRDDLGIVTATIYPPLVKSTYSTCARLIQRASADRGTYRNSVTGTTVHESSNYCFRARRCPPPLGQFRSSKLYAHINMLRDVLPSFLTLGFLAITNAAQPSAPAPVSAPLRDLTWGQLNFLHTTDTHGWHAGHLQE